MRNREFNKDIYHCILNREMRKIGNEVTEECGLFKRRRMDDKYCRVDIENEHRSVKRSIEALKGRIRKATRCQ